MQASSRVLLTIASVLLLVTAVAYSQTCESANCPESSSNCCLDVDNGPMCYSTNDYSCIPSNGGKFKMCPKGASLCGTNSCYYKNSHMCFTEILGIHFACEEAPGSAILCVRPENYLCPAGYKSCGGQCYDPAAQSCQSFLFHPFLCGAQENNCGNRCYNPQSHNCQYLNGEPFLCPKNQYLCGTQCFDPTTFICDKGTIIPRSEAACGSSGSQCPEGKSCCRKNELTTSNNDACFDLATQTCTACGIICPTGNGCCQGAFTAPVCYNKSTKACCPTIFGNFVCNKGAPGCCL